LELEESWQCSGCGQPFPRVAGLPDLRLHSDRYLSLGADRAKALLLADRARVTDHFGLARAYYVLTADVDPVRRRAYLAHLERAEARGRAMLRLLPRTGRVLEVGCGSGGFLAAAASAGREIVGVDIALRWLVIAERRLSDRGLQVPLFGATAERLPWPDATFGAVVADSVLEHLTDFHSALKEWARVLRPGGSLVLWSPNRFSMAPDPHVGLWGVGWLPETLASKWVRRVRGCEWTVRPLSAQRARLLAAQAGFESIAIAAPRLGRELARGATHHEAMAIRLHDRARRLPVASGLLRRFGPLWQLTALRRPA
jgi:SAM-dependent methyltransferase